MPRPILPEVMKARAGVPISDLLALLWAKKLQGYSITTITGIPPLSFRADGRPLISWYMLGNGQQTGTPSPDNIIMPDFVGVRTGNLWNEDYTGISGIAKYVAINVGSGDFTLSSTVPRSGTAAVLFLLAGNVSTGISSDSNGVWDGQSRTVTAVDGFVTIAFRAYTATNPENSKTMLNTGSTALPYEKFGYKIPITVGDFSFTILGVQQSTNYAYISKSVLPNASVGDYISTTIDGVDYSLAIMQIDDDYIYIENRTV